MFAATDSAWAPWFVAQSDDKQRARVNIISHLLESIKYKDLPREKVVLPRDVVVAQELAPNVRSRITVPGDVEPHEMILDVGPRTISDFARRLRAVKTLVWNGPFGAFETPPFDRGTDSAAQAVAELTREGKLLSVAGGGDTVAALSHAGVMNDFSYVSTAGGAFLEWLEGRAATGQTAS